MTRWSSLVPRRSISPQKEYLKHPSETVWLLNAFGQKIWFPYETIRHMMVHTQSAMDLLPKGNERKHFRWAAEYLSVRMEAEHAWVSSIGDEIVIELLRLKIRHVKHEFLSNFKWIAIYRRSLACRLVSLMFVRKPLSIILLRSAQYHYGTLRGFGMWFRSRWRKTPRE